MSMKQRNEFEPKHSGYGLASLALLAVALLILVVTSTVLDASLGGVSLSAQRWIGFVTLVLPAVTGAILGAMGLFRANQRKGLSLLGLILNTIFALFFAAVLSFAG